MLLKTPSIQYDYWYSLKYYIKGFLSFPIFQLIAEIYWGASFLIPRVSFGAWNTLFQITLSFQQKWKRTIYPFPCYLERRNSYSPRESYRKTWREENLTLFSTEQKQK